MTPYTACMLCAHRCGARRTAGERGRCGASCELTVARAAAHMWEEPPISGERGSGTVFFSGCSLGCLYCQNREISHDGRGRQVSTEHLSDIFLSLEAQGVHNINLVTPTHFAPSIRDAILLSRERGLTLPIVYNTSSFDTPETLRLMADVVDIYLADLKYATRSLAARLSGAPSYPLAAREAIGEMVRQRPQLIYAEDGTLRRGVLVRVLLLPGHVAEAKLCVRDLFRSYGDRILISIMNQYTPSPDLPSPFDRPVTRREYQDLLSYVDKIGVKNGFTQGEGTATFDYTPLFDFTGI